MWVHQVPTTRRAMPVVLMPVALARAVAEAILADTAPPPRPAHQHEAWQLQDGPNGRICAACGARVDAVSVVQVVPEAMDHITKRQRPHSRACGVTPHDHGAQCARDCPTCHPRG